MINSLHEADRMTQYGPAKLITVVFGCLILANCQKPVPQPPKAEIGRFVIVQSREQKGDFLLDTATGKVWASYQLMNHGNRVIWLYTTRLDNPKQTIDHMTYLSSKPETSTPIP